MRSIQEQSEMKWNASERKKKKKKKETHKANELK